MEPQSTAISTESGDVFEGLPLAWVDRIFRRLHGRFGVSWLDKWRVGCIDKNGEDIGVINAKLAWSETLAGFTGDEIRAGLDARYTYPPSCDEFAAACRPGAVLDLDVRMHVAIACMAARRNGEPENWPDNRTFWAAVGIGPDLLVLPPVQMRSRWAASWERNAHRQNDPIPPSPHASNALPAPGKTTITREEATERAQQIGLTMSTSNRPFRQWAYDIAAAPATFPRCSIEASVRALDFFGENLAAFPALLERADEVGLAKLVAKWRESAPP